MATTSRQSPPGFRVTARTDDALNAFERLKQAHIRRAVSPGGSPHAARRTGLAKLSAACLPVPRRLVAEGCHRGAGAKIRERLGESGRVVCGLSGGVDSTVAAALVHKAVGERQTCIFVDTGLLREGEFETTLSLFKQHMSLNVRGVRAGESFWTRLRGVTDPEQKRKTDRARLYRGF